eukprot:TRINITY_DN4506_c0_g1_i13.p1 TRINITY_DN4506_c0_g1~~TRINITY_DN4506_c0_g1_i13.p1  ORF type:complete len:582 (-),score=142.30 TRINITY_DN4506_c0_g1_i13:544-2265(-)
MCIRDSCWAVDSNVYIHGGFEHESPNIPTDAIIKVDMAKLFQANTNLLRALATTATNANSTMSTESGDYGGMNPPSPNLQPRGGQPPQGQGRPMMSTNDTADLGMDDMSKRSGGKEFSMNPKSGKPKINPALNPKTIRLSNQAVVAVAGGDEDGNQMIRKVPIDKLQEEAKKLGVGFQDPNHANQGSSYHESLYSMVLSQLLRPKDYNSVVSDGKFPIRKEIIIRLCDEIQRLLENQPTLLRLRAPLKIYADIHGQYSDLMRLFDLLGAPSDIHGEGDIDGFDYLFLGNYCDKGRNSLEVVCLLFALKLKHPEQFHMLRGNHEDKKVNKVFGLAEECARRIPEDITSPDSLYQRINRVFEYLPLAAVVEDRIFCVHGGIGSTLQSIEEIEQLDRPFEIQFDVNPSYQQQLIYDLLWSDPALSEADAAITPNPQRDFLGNGRIVRFGADRIQKFLANNNLNMIIRGHECVSEGFERFGNSNLITLFTCTDYCGRFQNAAGIILINKSFGVVPKIMYANTQNNNASTTSNWIDLDETVGKGIKAGVGTGLWYEEELKRRHPTPPRPKVGALTAKK